MEAITTTGNELAVTAASGRALQSQSQDEQPFRFFDLPRELRNNIYRLLAVPRVRFQPGENSRLSRAIKVKAINFCSPTLWLVSRQFKDEYEDECLAASEIYIDVDICHHIEAGPFHVERSGGRSISNQNVTMNERRGHVMKVLGGIARKVRHVVLRTKEVSSPVIPS
jgi:hypothetical protein